MDTASSNASQFDWTSEAALKENHLTLGTVTPSTEVVQDGGKRPIKFFVNATPVEGDEYVDPFTSTPLGVAQAAREKKQREREKQLERQLSTGSQSEEDWKTVTHTSRKDQPRRSSSRTREISIPGRDGSRQRMSAEQRIHKAMNASNAAAFKAQVTRIPVVKRSGSDLTRDNIKRSSNDKKHNNKKK